MWPRLRLPCRTDWEPGVKGNHLLVVDPTAVVALAPVLAVVSGETRVVADVGVDASEVDALVVGPDAAPGPLEQLSALATSSAAAAVNPDRRLVGTPASIDAGG